MPLMRNSEFQDQLFRAVARFCRTHRAFSRSSAEREMSQSDPRIERIIKQQIERFWLKKEKHRFSALWGGFTTFATSRVGGRHIEKQSSAALWA
jgi:hypothetical protein